MTNAARRVGLLAAALGIAGCSVVRPAPPLQGDGISHQTLGQVGRLEVLAASKDGRKQIDVLCHDEQGANAIHPSAQRLRLILARLDEMLASPPSAPGSSLQVGEVVMPIFGGGSAPKLTFGTTRAGHPDAPQLYEIDCYDAFIEHTQHYDFTRSETEEIRELFARARAWLRAE